MAAASYGALQASEQRNKIRAMDDLNKEAGYAGRRAIGDRQRAYAQTLSDIVTTRKNRPGMSAQTLLTSTSDPGRNTLLTIKGSSK
jgi:hypothetical protein